VVYDDLRARLCEPTREFHNIGHIDDCLRRLDDVRPHLGDADAVELALWFHDAVYVPGDPTNERRSAELFLSHAAGAPAALRRRVSALILTTRRNRTPRDNDCRFIDDIDLAGFGSPWEEFMRNGDLLRREFATQSDADYYRGLATFLTSLRAQAAAVPDRLVCQALRGPGAAQSRAPARRARRAGMSAQRHPSGTNSLRGRTCRRSGRCRPLRCSRRTRPR
jgi:predicted metal-dependent HD superfamily phosphohydrolase